jgi:predicted HicB family RNase H-like nuclease
VIKSTGGNSFLGILLDHLKRQVHQSFAVFLHQGRNNQSETAKKKNGKTKKGAFTLDALSRRVFTMLGII